MHRVNDSWFEALYGDEIPPDSLPVLQANTFKAFSESMPKLNPEDPAPSSAKLTWIGATIDVGRKTYCKAWAINHPGNFFVIQRKWWNRLEVQQAKIQTFFNNPVPGSMDEDPPNAHDDPRFKPDPKELKCGQIVAVFHRAEWHRGLILQIFEDKSKPVYKVMLVDFGDHKNHTLETIRFLPVKFLSFQAQAIRCCLYFDGAAKVWNGSKVEWTGLEGAEFQKLMDPCKLYMEFVEYEVDWNLANPIIWKCRVQRILSTHDLNRKYQVEKMYMGGKLLEKLQKLREDQKKGKEMKKEKYQSFWFNLMKSCSVTQLEGSEGLNVSLSGFDGVVCSAEKLGGKE